MVRIYGVSAEALDAIRPFVSDSNECGSGLYTVQIYDDVCVLYSSNIVMLVGSRTGRTLEMTDFERLTII